jgi:hypothetical protein
MPIRRVVSHEKVIENRGKVALERGPVVYCAEGIDNEAIVFGRVLEDGLTFTATHRPELLGGVTVLTGEAPVLRFAEDGGITRENQPFTAIPYYAWAHRGENPMTVWLARTDEAATPAPRPTLASKNRVTASFCNSGDTISALNDQFEPQSSNDHGIPRMTWWDHKGTPEWVMYEFPEPTKVSAVEVYWFDDEPDGQCRVPASWTLRARDGEGWTALADSETGGVEKDTFNRVEFDPILTEALRLSVKLQDGYSGGILEWKVE